MKQILMAGGQDDLPTAATQYAHISGPCDWDGTRLNRVALVQGGFTASRLRVELDGDPDAGSYVFAVMDGASSSGITVTIAAGNTFAEDTVNTHTFVDADDICMRVVGSGGPTARKAKFSLMIESTSSQEAWFGTNSRGDVLSNSATEYNGLFAHGQNWTGTQGPVNSVTAIAGTLTDLRVELSGAPGASTSYAFDVMKNGSPVGTTLTISDSETGDVVTGMAVAIAAGDIWSLRCTPTNTPAVVAARWGIAYTPTTNGESNIGGYTQNDTPSAATEYIAFTGGDSGSVVWGATESLHTSLAGGAGTPDWTLSDLIIDLDTAPGTSPNAFDFTIRKNAGDGNSTVNILGASETQDQDTVNTDTFTEGDEIALKVVPTSSPTVGDSRWAAVQRVGATVPVIQHHRQRNF